MLEWIYGNLITSIFVTILVFVFIAMLSYSASKSRLRNTRLSAVREILSRFENTDHVSGRNEALDYVNDHCNVSSVRRSWKEFDQSLLSFETDPRIRSTVDSSEYFNSETLAGELLHNRVLNLVPGLLTALGVLGTFLGLTIGLSGLQTGDDASTDQLRNGIQQLIAGASTAFLTSLAGIFLSLIASWFKGQVERKTVRNIIDVQGQINDLFSRHSPEQSLADIAEISRQSHASLQTLHERIGEQFQTSVQGLANDMQEAVASAITSALAPAMSNLTDSMSEQSNGLFEELVGKFASSFESIGDNQAKQLNSASESLNHSVGTVAEEFSGMLTAFAEQQIRSQESASKSTEDFQNQLDQLLNLADTQRSESFSTMEEIKKTLHKVSDALDSSSEQLVSVASSFQEASSKASGDIATISGNLSTAASHVTSASQHQTRSIEQLSEHREQLMQLQQHVRELAVHLENAVDKTSQTYGQLGEQQDSFLTGLKENIRQVNQSLTESVSSLTSDMNKWLQEYALTVSNHTAQRMDDWNLHSQDYARHMLQVASSLESVLDELPKATR